jgi:hypothetical protein
MPPIIEKDRLITPLTPGGMSDATKRMLGLPAPMLSSDDYQPSWWQLHMPSWLGGLPSAPEVPPGPQAGDPLDQETVGRARAVHDKLMGSRIPGMTDARAWGLAGNAVQESRADRLWCTDIPVVVGDLSFRRLEPTTGDPDGQRW